MGSLVSGLKKAKSFSYGLVLMNSIVSYPGSDFKGGLAFKGHLVVLIYR